MICINRRRQDLSSGSLHGFNRRYQGAHMLPAFDAAFCPNSFRGQPNMGAVIRFPAARASDAVTGRDFTESEARKLATIATLSSTLEALTAALAAIAEQIAALPEGSARMELTVQHLHLNLAAFKARHAIVDLARMPPDYCPAHP